MPKKMSKKKIRNIVIASVLAAVVIGGTLFAVFKPDEKIAVDTVTAAKQTIDETLDTTGTVCAASQDEFVLPKRRKDNFS